MFIVIPFVITYSFNTHYFKNIIQPVQNAKNESPDFPLPNFSITINHPNSVLYSSPGCIKVLYLKPLFYFFSSILYVWTSLKKLLKKNEKQNYYYADFYAQYYSPS